eukprot:3186998-Pleurochrysis_carterae.AAC.1
MQHSEDGHDTCNTPLFIFLTLSAHTARPVPSLQAAPSHARTVDVRSPTALSCVRAIEAVR